MSKANMAQKRSMGKRSPLSKRPKLDFTSGISDSPGSRTRSSTNGYYSSTKENAAVPAPEKKVQNVAACSDWGDDDISGDVLEEVCRLTDLSQAMAANEPIEEIRRPAPISTPVQEKKMNIAEELERIKLENEKLSEKLKTKEGEVQILRSKLNQENESKMNDTLHSKKLVDDVQQKCNEKISAMVKELEAMKTKLEFKDLEVKSLKCKQMETSASKIRLVEPEAMHVDFRKMNSSQMIPVQKHKEEIAVEESVNFNFPDEYFPHEGKALADLICPEFFKFIEEPDIIPLYTSHNGSNCHMSRLDFDKREKYKWSGLPKQNIFIKDTYNVVSNLFLCENFSEKKIKIVIEQLLRTCVTILTYQKDVLIFLEEIQRSYSENDDIDISLLENEDEVYVIPIKKLLNGEKIKKEECAIEARRTLALILSMIQSSQSVLVTISQNFELLTIMKDLATSIGNLRRPLRYTGLLISIVLIIKEILNLKNLSEELQTLAREIIQEVIFARPKLDVFREVILALQVGRHHFNFISSLCRKGSDESLLYMDSKLQQACFFTKDTCPLKLLNIQIMGLAGLPCSRKIRGDLANCIINWLNFLMDTSHCQKISWLPCNPVTENEDRCFDISECLVYLLNLCIRDYKKSSEKVDELVEVIGNGAALMQRILKTDQRLFHDHIYNLRFAVELKTVNLKNVSPIHSKAISWIINLFESDLKNQDGCVKQNINEISDKNLMVALKINDNDSKIY